MLDFFDYADRMDREKVKLIKDLPMSEYTSFKIGGKADFAVFPKTEAELMTAMSCADELELPAYVVGRGTNLLVSDEGFRGVIVFTGEMNSFEFVDCRVTAQAGVSLAALSREATKRGLSGLEFACGIPGTVGGAIYMNAGAYGSEMKDITVNSRSWASNVGVETLTGEEQRFGHRVSAYTASGKTVISCELELTEGNPLEIAERCRDLLMQRKEKQPLEYPSAGSAFKRYPGRYTAQMIDEAGLKGLSVGGAEVSRKHAGFIINTGGARASDVIELVKLIKERIYEKEGIEIESEIRYLSPKGEVRL